MAQEPPIAVKDLVAKRRQDEKNNDVDGMGGAQDANNKIPGVELDGGFSCLDVSDPDMMNTTPKNSKHEKTAATPELDQNPKTEDNRANVSNSNMRSN